MTGAWISLKRPPVGHYVRPAGPRFRARRHSPGRPGGPLMPAISRSAGRDESCEPARAPQSRVSPSSQRGMNWCLPGEEPGPDQIVASNIYARRRDHHPRRGGEAIDCGIARDLRARMSCASSMRRVRPKPDILITLGGASVGAHDLVQETLTGIGLELGFWRIAMRPGKPLMHGKARRLALPRPAG